VPLISACVTDLVDAGFRIRVEIARVAQFAGTHPPFATNALVDTGAAITVIGYEVAEKLELTVKGTGAQLFGVTSSAPALRYDVSLRVPALHVTIDPLVVLAGKLPTAPEWEPFRCVLGRDFLSRGGLVYLGDVATVSLGLGPATP